MKTVIQKRFCYGMATLCLSILLATNLMATCSELYGTDPLNPTPDSLIGTYLSNTQSSTVIRAFPLVHEGPSGIDRLVVTVSRDSYEEFARLFINDSILWLFHDPNSRILNASFNGRKGYMGRLELKMAFTFSGATLIPICLTTNETQRVKDFFKLAEGISERFDVALYPWLLTNSNGVPYMPSGDLNSYSDWFTAIPLGERYDISQKRIEYNIPSSVRPDLHPLLKNVWAFPYTNQSLAQVLNLRPFILGRPINTPGLIASSLLANVPSERLPVVFRYVEDHRDPLPPDFNTWFDIDFDPKIHPIFLRSSGNEESFSY